MDASTVSLALFMALLVDAVIDPILGNLGDRTYTRWGRRLPWLYASALPLAVAWVILWSPPTQAAPSFAGLLGIAIMVRLLLSACEVPSVALVPELTSDYDERTTLFRYRYLFGWIGGLGMMLLAYTVFLPGDAMLQREGYFAFGLFGAAVIFVSGGRLRAWPASAASPGFRRRNRRHFRSASRSPKSTKPFQSAPS